jgi:hypothetical protein
MQHMTMYDNVSVAVGKDDPQTSTCRKPEVKMHAAGESLDALPPGAPHCDSSLCKVLPRPPPAPSRRLTQRLRLPAPCPPSRPCRPQQRCPASALSQGHLRSKQCAEPMSRAGFRCSLCLT